MQVQGNDRYSWKHLWIGGKKTFGQVRQGRNSTSAPVGKYATQSVVVTSPNYSRQHMWNSQLSHVPAAIKIRSEAAESITSGAHQPWFCRRSLNRLSTVIGRAKTTMANHRQWPASSAAGYLMSPAIQRKDLITLTQSNQRTVLAGHGGRCETQRKTEIEIRGHHQKRYQEWADRRQHS